MIHIMVRVELECDHGPALCLRQPHVLSGASTFDVYNQARSQGWYVDGTHCLCPKHNPSLCTVSVAGAPTQETSE